MFAVNVRSSGSRRESKNATQGSTPKTRRPMRTPAPIVSAAAAKSRGRRKARYASTGTRCGFGMSTVSRPIATPPRGSCQRATARRTRTVIVLTLPMTRSWTIGGNASTRSTTPRRWPPLHRLEYQNAVRARTASLTTSQTQAAPSAESGISGAKRSAPIGVYLKVYVSDQSYSVAGLFRARSAACW